MQRPSVWRQQRAVKAARTGRADREVCRLLRARSWLQQLLPHPLVLPGHLPVRSWQKVKIWVHRNQRISKRDMAEGRGLNHRARFPCSSFHELGGVWRVEAKIQMLEDSPNHLRDFSSLTRGKSELKTCRGDGPGENNRLPSGPRMDVFLASHHTKN